MISFIKRHIFKLIVVIIILNLFYKISQLENSNKEKDFLLEELRKGLLFVDNRINNPIQKNQIFIEDNFEAVLIGDLIWMTKNLATDTFANGEKIPEIKDTEQWVKLKKPAWCYYDNSQEYGKKYGKIYNWYAVSDLRGLCPNGWEVATSEDFKTLVGYYGGGIVAVNYLKDSIGWWGYSGNNLSGFSALPGGYRPTPEESNNFDFEGLSGRVWWTSTRKDTKVLNQYVSQDAEAVDIGHDHVAYTHNIWSVGQQVRCVKRIN